MNRIIKIRGQAAAVKIPNYLGFDPQLFLISEGTHREKSVIWLQFEYDLEKINYLKEHTHARWSSSKRAWYLPDNAFTRRICHLEPKFLGKEAISKIKEVNFKEFTKMQNHLILKCLSPNTIKTYLTEFAQLLYLLKDSPVNELSPEKLQSYFLYCNKKLGLSENQIHVRMNAIKYYFEKVLHKEKMFFDIPRPKKPQQLPKFLNTEEIQKLFSVVDNSKHRLLLQLCYGMGLRVSEMVGLHISDIDSKSMKVHIRNSKGKKDRYVNLPESVLEDLRMYYLEYRPKNYLFEGQEQGQYSVRSVQLVFKNAMKKAGIKKNVGIHGLRHSFATHLLEYGTDISLIQKLLGHSDIKTTLVYTHVSASAMNQIESPLDKIRRQK